MNQYKISIIIPVFGVEPYIENCLLSVINQTMTEGVECIIVDDCGPDNSIKIAERVVSDYQGQISFSIIYHEKNKGLSGARNTGILASKGDYLYLLDSDDTITPDCIESMYSMVRKYPNVECVFSGIKASNGKFRWMDYTKKNLPEYSDNRDWIQVGMLKRFEFSMTAVNRLISSEFVRTNNLLFEEGFIHEDEIWNLFISQHIKSAAFLHKNTYNYIIRDNSIITSAQQDFHIILTRKFRVVGRMLDLVNGYRAKIQPYYIIAITKDFLSSISTSKDFILLNKLFLKAIIKSDLQHALRLIKRLLKWDKEIVFNK